jgi:hypothetical protein
MWDSMAEASIEARALATAGLASETGSGAPGSSAPGCVLQEANTIGSSVQSGANRRRFR